MEQKGFIKIAKEHIRPNPDNPRKNLGDLTELTESIKKNGIMQNLTVVPVEGEAGEYMIIIGHRRYAAGIQAGVTEFPCKITEGLSKREEMGIMLEENMQRNDLTIWEQANGFQMMLDLGETEDSIAAKTGFSKPTIKHRLQIAKLNSKELQKKEKDESFQLTLKDLYELEKIENIKTRNKILRESRDSRDLVWRAKREAREELCEKNKKRFEKLLEKAGIKKAPERAQNEKFNAKWNIIKTWDLEENVPEDIPEKIKKTKDAQWVVYYNRELAIIKPAKKERTKTKWEIEEEERKKTKKIFLDKQNELYKDIKVFIQGIITKKIDPVKEDIDLYKDLLSVVIECETKVSNYDLANRYNGKHWYDIYSNEVEKKAFDEWKKSLGIVNLTITGLEQVTERDLCDYYLQYNEDNAVRVKAVVDFLKKYGFSLTEEQQQILYGTHELYAKEE